MWRMKEDTVRARHNQGGPSESWSYSTLLGREDRKAEDADAGSREIKYAYESRWKLLDDMKIGSSEYSDDELYLKDNTDILMLAYINIAHLKFAMVHLKLR